MQALVVNDNGVKLTYTDSGAPRALSDSGAPYTTVFAVHGMGFNANVFERLSALAGTANLRLVAINRRPYGGSTPFSPEELSRLAGSDEERLEYVTARGVEFAAFVDRFIREFDVPAISGDGKGGGMVFLPWSAGNGCVLAALANIKNLPEATRARIASHVRVLIMYEPPAAILGTPVPPAAWPPSIDPRVLSDFMSPAQVSWLASYFTHGDLSTRKTDVLSYAVPSTARAPSVDRMSAEDIASVVERDGAAVDARAMGATMLHALTLYRKACFDRETRAMVPRMRIRLLCGENTVPDCVAGFWSVLGDDEAKGGGFVEGRMIPGINHFMHWDDPEVALGLVREAIDGV